MTDWHREAELNAQRIIELEAEKDALIRNYTACMTDYAKAIFSDIAKITAEHKISTTENNFDDAFLNLIDELEKKYTEGKV